MAITKTESIALTNGELVRTVSITEAIDRDCTTRELAALDAEIFAVKSAIDFHTATLDVLRTKRDGLTESRKALAKLHKQSTDLRAPTPIPDPPAAPTPIV